VLHRRRSLAICAVFSCAWFGEHRGIRLEPSPFETSNKETSHLPMISLTERALLPLDAARGSLLRLVASVPALRRLAVSRNVRVPIGLTVHVLVAFTIALLVPSLSLVVAPIVLGVPHIASDVRYLVLRRALPSFWLWAIAFFIGALFLLRLMPVLYPTSPDRIFIEHLVASSWVLLGALLGTVVGGFRKVAGIALAMAAGIAVLSLVEPHPFRLILGHAHNLIAVVIWLLLFRRSLRVAWLPVALVLILGGWLASGDLLGFTMRHGVLSVFGLHLFFAADWLAPGIRDPLAIGLTSAFAFLQSVHYGIWLWAIPQDEAKAERTATFRMTWRALLRDFHPIGIRIVVATVLLVLALGSIAPVRTQTLILSLGGFHAWLELALFAFLLARGDVTAGRCGGAA
jgi:hypothetical protein